MNRPKVKKCKDCAFCEQLYEEGGYGVFPRDVYLCLGTEEFTGQESSCERWQEKVPEYDLSAERFKKVEADILAIKQIFKEKKIHFVTFRPRKRRIST